MQPTTNLHPKRIQHATNLHPTSLTIRDNHGLLATRRDKNDSESGCVVALRKQWQAPAPAFTIRRKEGAQAIQLKGGTDATLADDDAPRAAARPDGAGRATGRHRLPPPAHSPAAQPPRHPS